MDFNGDGGPDLAVTDVKNNIVITLVNTAESSASISGIEVPGAGTHELKATYAGSAPYTGSTSGGVAVSATPVRTTVTITPVPGWIVNAGTTVTLNVAVSPASIDNYTLSGIVALYNGSTLAGQATLSSGQAKFSVPLTTLGTYNFTAQYGGSTDFAASTSSVLPVHVEPASAIALSVSVNSVVSGSPVTLTAKATSGGKILTEGVVTFCDATATSCDNSAVLGTANLTTSGTAALKLTLDIGTHSIKAVFAPTLTATGSTSSPQTVTVTGLYATKSTLTDSLVSGTYTLVAKVAGNSILQPTGNVSFVDSTSNKTLGTAALEGGSPSLSFAAATSPVVGANPQAVVVGDFNLDGKPDLAVANATSGTVTILLGNGNGAFTVKSTAAVGADPTAIAVVDFNGDGIPDLAVANFASNNVTILLGAGDGTFTTKSSPAVGSSPIAIVAADFNADGILDLAVLNDGSADVTILLGNGDGTFGTSESAPLVDYLPNGIAVGDFNEDGRPDLAVTSFGSNSVMIFQGNGDGTFTQAAKLPTGNGPKAAVIGDFNGDGHLDLAIANSISGTLTIFSGTGKGTFGAPATVPVSLHNELQSMVVGDFNQDGKLDLAVTVYNNAEALILLGNGNGTFTLQATPLKTGSAPQSIAVGDFNGDGKADLAVANDQSNNVSVLLNSLTTSRTATLSGITVSGSGNQSVVAKYAESADYAASTSNTLSLPPN